MARTKITPRKQFDDEEIGDEGNHSELERMEQTQREAAEDANEALEEKEDREAAKVYTAAETRLVSEVPPPPPVDSGISIDPLKQTLMFALFFLLRVDEPFGHGKRAGRERHNRTNIQDSEEWKAVKRKAAAAMEVSVEEWDLGVCVEAGDGPEKKKKAKAVKANRASVYQKFMRESRMEEARRLINSWRDSPSLWLHVSGQNSEALSHAYNNAINALIPANDRGSVCSKLFALFAPVIFGQFTRQSKSALAAARMRTAWFSSLSYAIKSSLIRAAKGGHGNLAIIFRLQADLLAINGAEDDPESPHSAPFREGKIAEQILAHGLIPATRAELKFTLLEILTVTLLRVLNCCKESTADPWHYSRADNVTTNEPDTLLFYAQCSSLSLFRVYHLYDLGGDLGIPERHFEWMAKISTSSRETADAGLERELKWVPDPSKRGLYDEEWKKERPRIKDNDYDGVVNDWSKKNRRVALVSLADFDSSDEEEQSSPPPPPRSPPPTRHTPPPSTPPTPPFRSRTSEQPASKERKSDRDYSSTGFDYPVADAERSEEAKSERAKSPERKRPVAVRKLEEPYTLSQGSQMPSEEEERRFHADRTHFNALEYDYVNGKLRKKKEDDPEMERAKLRKENLHRWFKTRTFANEEEKSHYEDLLDDMIDEGQVLSADQLAFLEERKSARKKGKDGKMYEGRLRPAKLKVEDEDTQPVNLLSDFDEASEEEEEEEKEEKEEKEGKEHELDEKHVDLPEKIPGSTTRIEHARGSPDRVRVPKFSPRRFETIGEHGEEGVEESDDDEEEEDEEEHKHPPRQAQTPADSQPLVMTPLPTRREIASGKGVPPPPDRGVSPSEYFFQYGPRAPRQQTPRARKEIRPFFTSPRHTRKRTAGKGKERERKKIRH